MIGNNVEKFSFEAYKKAGEDRALRLENRGPFRRTSDSFMINISRTIGTGSTFWKMF